LISLLLIVTISLVWAWITHLYYRKSIKAKQETKVQLNFMQEIVDSIPHPIYVRDVAGTLILCNISYQETFGAKNRNDILDRNIFDGIDRVPEVTDLKKEYDRAIEDGTSILKDRLIHIDGKPVNIYHWIKPYKDNFGTTLGIVGGWIDVSDRIELIEKLVIAKNAADSASKAKTQFLATMSHEIRTPMNAIIGLLELSLKRAEKNQFDFKSIKVAYNSAKDLLEIIGDILDVIKIESGALDLKPEKTRLKAIIESVIRVFESVAKNKGLSISLSYDKSIPKYLLLDPLRIKQIVSNLISNSIKFTDNGGIDIIVKRIKKHSNSQDLELIIKVIDTGIGISYLEQEKLFTPFTQVQETSSRGGTGLGLMICRALCTLMGGKISLESEPGNGTCVSIHIPTTIIEDEMANDEYICLDEPNSRTASMRVLIADDHPASRLLLSQQLRHLGYVVEEASNGVEALSLYKKSPFQLVITDCNMPEMGGNELSQCIRAFENQANLRPTIIIGYTANAQNSVKESSLESGMDDCLFKPIGIDNLKKTIDLQLTRKEHHNVNEVLHKQAIYNITGGDENFTQTILQKLITSNNDDMNELKIAFDIGDLDSAKCVAHKIKGAAKTLSATKIVELCEKIESSEVIYQALEAYNDLFTVIKKYNEEILII
ncbi:ATP-binding protein, partial [Shewanella algae]|uniref:ATP-binding protein n=1 Tax=Shewanella algae TaxID=38313 RepID=UPI001F2FF59A